MHTTNGELSFNTELAKLSPSYHRAIICKVLVDITVLHKMSSYNKSWKKKMFQLGRNKMEFKREK